MRASPKYINVNCIKTWTWQAVLIGKYSMLLKTKFKNLGIIINKLSTSETLFSVILWPSSLALDVWDIWTTGVSPEKQISQTQVRAGFESTTWRFAAQRSNYCTIVKPRFCDSQKDYFYEMFQHKKNQWQNL